MANQALVVWAAEWGWSQWLYLPIMLVVWVFSPVLAAEWIGCFRKKDGG
jgi:hypothetical protein